LVRDWLEAAADTGYLNKNYGIVLNPEAGSNVLKGFFSMHAPSGYSPQLYFIVNKNGDIDTVTHTIVETMFLADADVAPVPGRFFLHSGISYYEVMEFYINSIPSTATINDAKILLYLDSANSVFTNAADQTFKANFITDSAALTIETLEFLSTQTNSSSKEFQIRMVFPFQRWMRGEPNNGLLISPVNNLTDLSKYVFYGLDSPDPDKRPRVIVRYTPRITPDNIKKNEVPYENAE
jgi:hypothetical protein